MYDLSEVIYGHLVENIHFFDNFLFDDKKLFLATIGPYLKKVKFSRNEVIYGLGEYSREMYFIKSGIASLVIPECNNAPFLRLCEGNYFGEVDLIFGDTRRFKTVAYTDLEVLVLGEMAFRRIMMREFSEIGKVLRKRAEQRRISQIQSY